MRSLIFAVLFIGATAQAEIYNGYCQLENIPAVANALAAEVYEVGHGQPMELGEKVAQYTISGMGDAFDYWGNDLLVFGLSEAYTYPQVVAVKVSYHSVMARDYAEYENVGGQNVTFLCTDTGETNPELMYFEDDLHVVPHRF